MLDEKSEDEVRVVKRDGISYPCSQPFSVWRNIDMNQANLLIYLFTIMAATSLSWGSYKRRFLPVARPLAALTVLWILFCIVNALTLLNEGAGQAARQFLQDLHMLMVDLVGPLWGWMLVEIYEDKKAGLKDKRILLLLIFPLITYSQYAFQVYSGGFLDTRSASALFAFNDRMGAFAKVREAYGWLSVATFVIATPYLIIRKHRSSVLEVLEVFVYTALPFVFFILYYLQILSLRLGAPAFVLYLYWISRQYRFLDPLPVALREIIDKVESGVVVASPQASVMYVNDSANNMLDLGFTPNAGRELAFPESLHALFDLSSTARQEARLKTADRCFDTVMQPVFNPKTNAHLGAAVLLHDVTARTQAEQALRDFYRQKSDFFAGISHEFRTPLTLSLGNLDDLLDTQKPLGAAMARQSLETVKYNNLRLLNLVNQLLELSQLDAGSLQIHPALLQLDRYLPSLIANFQSQAARQGVCIHCDVSGAAGDASKVYFDVDAFDKVVLNLVSNALKSMPEGGDLCIDLAEDGEQELRLTIRDNGCGIPAKALPHIFEMFYSHQNHNPHWPQGTGVGLSLVKQLVVQHAADIQLESVEQQGTTCSLLIRKGTAHFPTDLPLQHTLVESSDVAVNSERVRLLKAESAGGNSAAADASPVPDRHVAAPLDPCVVLLAEDSADMRAYIRRHLTSNIRLLEAEDGEEALALALQAVPDLVLSDVMMPRMDGYELCKHLKAHPQTSHVPVVLLTAKSSEEEKLKGLAAGADDYLSKPFNVPELNLRLANLIQSRRNAKSYFQAGGLHSLLEESPLARSESEFLQSLHDFILEHLSDPALTVSDLASAVHMSERSLNRKLKALTDESPKKMILATRLQQATKLLVTTDQAITSVSYLVGFADASHFARCFKDHYAMTPSAYRKQHGG